MTSLPPPRHSRSRPAPHRCNLPEPNRRGIVVQCSSCSRRWVACYRRELPQRGEPLVWRRRWWPWPRPMRRRMTTVELPASTTRDSEAIDRHWYGPDA